MNRKYVISVLSVLFLSACSGPTYTTRVLDAPPNRTLKPWERPYEVNGQRYQPIYRDACAGFAEEGLASWYGKDFHGRKTSNGEVYDMHARTAAHKTLPLGVYVKVRNLVNGRETVARINDRGPFVKGRIIDLSYTIARELDIVGPGTAPVRIEVLGYEVRDASGKVAYQASAGYTAGSYGVQLGSFSEKENASRLASQLRDASIKEERIDGRLFYRVRAGKYKSQEEAQRAKRELEQSGYPNGLVVALE